MLIYYEDACLKVTSSSISDVINAKQAIFRLYLRAGFL